VRLLGHMVTYNEADRYLRQALRSLRMVCDEISVYDDMSDDDTVDIALAEGAYVGQRGGTDVTFAQHEGKFRQAAWDTMEEDLKPELGDWILSTDADEVLVSDDGDPSILRRVLAATADAHVEVQAIRMRIHEIWALDPPLERVDGFWGAIEGARLFRWSPGARFEDRALGCGSVPGGPTAGGDVRLGAVRIGHLGYVRQADRDDKYERYAGRPGHASKHVESILTEPTLQPLDGLIR
jgi:hypothetical protein